MNETEFINDINNYVNVNNVNKFVLNKISSNEMSSELGFKTKPGEKYCKNFFLTQKF